MSPEEMISPVVTINPVEMIIPEETISPAETISPEEKNREAMSRVRLRRPYPTSRLLLRSA